MCDPAGKLHTLQTSKLSEKSGSFLPDFGLLPLRGREGSFSHVHFPAAQNRGEVAASHPNPKRPQYLVVGQRRSLAALRYPENRSGLRCSSYSPTAAEIPQCLHLPLAAALRDSAHGRDSRGTVIQRLSHSVSGISSPHPSAACRRGRRG